MLPLDIRLSKAQVMAIADNLHHDEWKSRPCLFK